MLMKIILLIRGTLPTSRPGRWAHISAAFMTKDDLCKYASGELDSECGTDLRVGALDTDGLEVDMKAHDEGVPALGAAVQFVRGDGQRGGAAHRLQQAQAALLPQQGVHAELTQADGPREGVACGGTHTDGSATV